MSAAQPLPYVKTFFMDLRTPLHLNLKIIGNRRGMDVNGGS